MADGGRGPDLTPVLLAIQPVLAFGATNVGEFTARELVATLLTFALVGLLLTLAVRGALRRRDEAVRMLVAIALVGWLLASQLVVQSIPGLRARWGMPAAFLLAGALCWAALRRRGFAQRWRGPVRLVVWALVAIAAASLLRVVMRQRTFASRSALVGELASPIPVTRPTPDSAKPDIYVFVLDSRASGAALLQGYGLDTRAFEDSLRALGFVIPARGRSNYAWTAQSVPSLLNAAHLASLERDVDPGERSSQLLYRLGQNNRLSRFLRSEGYQVYAPPSIGFPGTWSNADRTARGVISGVSPWRATLARAQFATSVARSTVPGAVVHAWRGDPTFADVVLATLRGVPGVVTRPGPKLVIVHTLLAHEPYLFDAECRATGRVRNADAAAYRDQVTCLDRLVLDAVTVIRTRSARPAVIVLQADHGTGRLQRPDLPAERITPEAARERFSAFAAYSFPGVDRSEIRDDITAVNAMRLLLRHYLGAALPAVEDASFYAASDRPYHFVRIPDSVFAPR